MNGMLQSGQLDAFIVELVSMHNEEAEDKALWEVWLQRVFDKSYNDFVEGIKSNSKAAPTKDETVGIVSESQNILDHFKPVER